MVEISRAKIRVKFDTTTLQRYFAQSTKAKVGAHTHMHAVPPESGRVIEKYRHFGGFYPTKWVLTPSPFTRWRVICVSARWQGANQEKILRGKYRLETTIPFGWLTTKTLIFVKGVYAGKKLSAGINVSSELGYSDKKYKCANLPTRYANNNVQHRNSVNIRHVVYDTVYGVYNSITVHMEM